MALIRRKRLTNADIEKTILIGLVTSSRVLDAVQPLAEPELFQLDVSRIISKWCFDYYDQYKTPPAESLEAIFQAEKSSLKESDQQLVSEFLRTLSKEFVSNPPNEEYVATQAVDFLRRQRLLNLSKEMQGILELGGNTNKVEALISSYRQVSNGVPIAKDMFDPAFITTIFDSQETPLMEFSGALGKFIGPLRRGYLFGLMGPMKRGKTTWLMRFATQAMMQRLRVAFFSLEMTAEQMGLRFLQHFAAMGKPSKVEEQEYTIPSMDCRLNQENECTSAVRTCRVPIPEGGTFRTGQAYIPCSACRYENRTPFVPLIYYVKETRPALTRASAKSLNDQFLIQFGPSLLQLIGFPAYSATLKDIEAELNVMEFQGFIPDVVIIDYPDILAPEDLRADKIDQINQNWMRLKAISQTRRCLVYAPTQGSRQSFKKALIDPTDVPWDIRKLAHVDLMVGLNQTVYEKKDQITRLNIIAHRWEEFHPHRVYVALQQLKIAQPELDGYTRMYSPK